MKRLVIAVDCDDVLIETVEKLVEEYNRRYNTDVKIENAFVRNNPDWGAERNEVFARFRTIFTSKEFEAITPRPDAVEVVQRLAMYHELHLVTARFLELELVTLRMLNTYFKDCFTEMNHVGDGSKGDICRAVRADTLIDDNAKHLIDAKNCGVDSTIWFGDYPWQSHDSDFVDYTARCKDLYEVEKEIERIANA